MKAGYAGRPIISLMIKRYRTQPPFPIIRLLDSHCVQRHGARTTPIIGLNVVIIINIIMVCFEEGNFFFCPSSFMRMGNLFLHHGYWNINQRFNILVLCAILRYTLHRAAVRSGSNDIDSGGAGIIVGRCVIFIVVKSSKEL